MKSFAEHNPIPVFVCFASIIIISMFCMNPIVLGISLVGAMTFYLVRNGKKNLKSHLWYLLLFVIIALINPIFSHNGSTVLFFVNDRPITMEAVVYGLVLSGMIISVLYWFRSFSEIMTSDKLLYLFDRLSPKTALIMSLTLRYIPLFKKQTQKINQAQKALGLYKQDNIADNIRGGIRVFSVMVTWALENGIITADSMTARGYGSGKRSCFAIYRLYKADYLLLLLILLLTAIVLTGMGIKAIDFAFYPNICIPDLTLKSAAVYSIWALLSFLPTIVEIKEKIKWKYLQSTI